MFVKSRDRFSKMNRFRAKVMDEARLCIATAGGWVERPANWERGLQQAATRLSMAYSRVFNIWYGRAVPWADELEEMKSRIAEITRRETRLEHCHAQIKQARTLARREDDDFGRVERKTVDVAARGSQATEAVRTPRHHANARPALPADD